MKKFYLLLFLLVSVISYAQVEKYEVTISNLSYRINKGVKNSSNNSKIRITIFFESGPPKDIYLRQITEEGDNEKDLNIPPFTSFVKPISLECYAKVNFRTGDDADGTVSKSLNSICPNGNFNESYSRRMDNIKFNYKVEPIIAVNKLSGNDILPTHSKVTITSTPGYDLQNYRWQYTLLPNGNSTIWTDLPQYNDSPSITVDAVDILGANAGLHIGEKINFRIKPCSTTSKLNESADYSIRLSAPIVNSLTRVQPRCSYSDDGFVQLIFDRTLLNGEQLNYTLYDEVAKTPTGFNGVLAIDDNKTFSITGLPAGTYTLQLIGFKNGLNTYVPPGTDPDLFDLKTFTITPPTPVDFSITAKHDIKCHGGKDGIIEVKASGGVEDGIYQYATDGGTDWTNFSNGAETIIPNLTLGIHSVKVRQIKDADDKIGCVAKLNGNDKQLSEEIGQPAGPLVLVGTVITSNPTFHNAENGIITASFSGGTPIGGKSYSFVWTNSKNETIAASKSSTQFQNNTFIITLKDVPADTYRLTVTDERGCIIDETANENLKIVLDNPEPIEIKIEVKQDISCSSESLDPTNNEKKSEDGILEAKVKGGVQFQTGLPYKFFWSKYNEDTKKWDELTDKKTAVADNLSKGTYSINVEDANGIQHGTYTLTEQTPIAVDTTLIEPDPMMVEFSTKQVSCFQGKNGSAKAAIKDGKSTYKYTWYGPNHNGTVAEEITDLISGTYYVDVLDELKGCFVKDSIEIKQPLKEVKIVYDTITAPTFYGAANGKMVVKITGGTPFEEAFNNGKLYDFEWRNSKDDLQAATFQVIDGVFTITLENLPADTYYLTIKDKNYDEATSQIINCSILKSKMQLTQPDPLKVVFKIVRAISCNDKNEFGNKKDTAPQDGQRDESQDGILMANVTGGTPLAADKNNGLPYFYYWKKQQNDGTWKDLAVQDSIISNLSHGNYALNVKDRYGIILGTYKDGVWTAKDSIQLLDQPPVLAVKIDKGDVFCKGGNDGWAKATVEGGIPPYDYKWSNGVEIDENTVLRAGDYTVLITDFNKCTAFGTITITEPPAPLTIQYKDVINPSFYKATNGKIVVEVTGGTIFKDNTYWFEWKNSKGDKQTTTTTSFSDNIYKITLDGLGEETYTLTVRDANYNDAINKTGCTVANFVTELEDPDPLEVSFNVIRPISCNLSNEFGNETDANPLDNQRDESQDGILKANVKGGIQLDGAKNNGLPYYYTWKKKQADGTWVIWNNTDDTAEYLSEGTYALNIEDANGIKLGTYVDNALVKEIDAEKYMEQPDQLKLTFTKFDVGCTTGDDGWAEAHVTGGIPPYTYEWTNGETTSLIENVTANNYFVKVTDDKGCAVQGNIFVGDPNGILATEKVKNPICYQGNDGSIELNVTGGNLPYTYLWNTGANTKDLNNLSAGNYEVTITCPDCCVFKKRFVLNDPEPVIVNIGPDRTLCMDQTLDLDAAVSDAEATYSWTSTNGFTSNEPKISVSKAGTYHVKVTSALGCIGEDEIVIKTSQMAISAEFLLSSQAYLDEEVILVNTSNPFGESTDWVIPNGVKVVEQKEKYITLKFDAAGVYSIGLKQTQGDCYAVYTKNIMVEQRGTMPNTGTTSQFIIDFIVTPNPSNGNFKAIVNLENSSAINLRLFSSSGQNTMIQKQDSGKKKYEVDFDTSLQAGMYILVLETEQQTLVKKIIIN